MRLWSSLKMGAIALLALLLLFAQPGSSPAADSDVTRATLPNGLRVVIIRNPLAPVVTVMQNYLAGADETPAGFPGTAHAQEHMAFRGCSDVSGDQTAAIYAQLGGADNADTDQNITQYYTTVRSSDLDIALRLDSSCMQDIKDDEAEWAKEKGAIEQEVARDLSNPTYKFITRLNQDMFAGTPYSHDALGTRESFDKTTAAMLRDYYKTWYAPNNAILVIAGDVQPRAVLEKVREYYGKIPRHSVPARPKIELPPVKPESFTLDSNLPYQLAFLSFRMPGIDSPDFVAVEVLADVIGSERAKLYDLVPQGKALDTGFGLAEHFPKASVVYSAAAMPADADAAPVVAEMRKIIADYAANGVPADLVDAAKRKAVAGAAFRRNSIAGLAREWSQALAAEGRNSPDDELNAMKRVTTADVNRVAKKYLIDSQSITAVLKPMPTGAPISNSGFGGTESLTAAPSKPVVLPDWAAARLLAIESRLLPRLRQTSLCPTACASSFAPRPSAPPSPWSAPSVPMPRFKLPAARRAFPRCSAISSPMAPSRSTGWRSRRPSTISPPPKPAATAFLSRC